MARPRKYTGETLLDAVGRYFASISTTAPAQNQHGEVLLNDYGEPIPVRTFVRPPTEGGLCAYLGIDKATWYRYGQRENYKDAVALAKNTIETWLEEQLVTREKNVNGLIFNLQNNYGWKDRRELELAGETKVEVSTAAMSIEDKLRAIRQAQMEASK